METVEHALDLLISNCKPLTCVENRPLEECLGRIAAEDACSSMAVPPFDRSPVDGYAVHSLDIKDARTTNPIFLRVIGEADAGCSQVFHPKRGEALRIMTGAPVPKECDAVIRQEDTDYGMDQVAVLDAIASGMNVCKKGEDVKEGVLVIQKGERLTPSHLGVLASLGLETLPVFAKPRVGVLGTGDELTASGEVLSYGHIYDSNGVLLRARLKELGMVPVNLGVYPDDPDAVVEAIQKAIGKVDLLLTTGGVSVGNKDIMHCVVDKLGAEKLFWKVEMKPGTPLLTSIYQGKCIVSLSGNPFAALTCFEVFAKPMLYVLSGRTDEANPRREAILDGQFPKASKGRRMVRAHYDGKVVHVTTTNHSSGSLFSNIGCNCLLDLPAGSAPKKKGDVVEILLLSNQDL